MKKFPISLVLIMLVIFLDSCSAIEGIFKAGMGFGIFTVLLVIFVIGVLIMRSKKNK